MFITSGTTKRRQLPGPVLAVNAWTRVSPSVKWIPQSVYSSACYGTQITESDGNRWPLPKGSDISDSGSEFYTRKTEILSKRFPHTSIYTVGTVPGQPTNKLWKLDGSFFVANGFQASDGSLLDSGFKQVAPIVADLSSSRSALVTKGAIAVAACNPGNQIANVASSVGELLQDVPAIPGVSLWKGRLRAIEAIAGGASEFLNLTFGITPTISDMMSFLKATHKLDKAVDQFIRDSGRTVRREFHFPKEISESTTTLTNVFSPVGCVNSLAGTNVLLRGAARAFPVYETIRKRTVERDIWFSGAFTYHLPDWYETGNRKDRMLLTAKILGSQPDLNTLWQLTPWSWAVDWFSNAGQFVKNLQSLISYGTVLRYGYVMETTTVTDTYSAGNVLFTPDSTYWDAYKPPYPAVAPLIVKTTVKKRIQANPFGFGVSWDGLSTTQQAIAAALGITRVVR
ncbi:maturation protein [ssRNA phage Gerhypos.4_29]|uniref:Maturation protein n=2 Tax=Leviviricetes TaxID=2842243 RepID=A0A8S5L1Y3_9VIRU|nr:maturation protein [ssRNA phage Gerhypos.4_29]QDH89763.1 MAG: hypothetical protein H4Bulk46574_000003 [Leviviridae sp.]DAD51491.1 TPA_asm: maturation protein [ssRNA phage Gerhypos.4_29]